MSDQQHSSVGAQVGGSIAAMTTLTCWSFGPLLIAMLADTIDTHTNNGWRYSIAALIWLPLILKRLAAGTFPKALWAAAIPTTLWNLSGQVAFVESFQRVDPGIVAFALRAQIIAVAIGAALMYASERRVIKKPFFLAGGVMVVIGTSLVIALGYDNANQLTDVSQTDLLIGAGLAAFSGIAFGGYAVAVKSVMRIASPFLGYGVISIYTSAALIPLMLMFGENYGMAPLDFDAKQLGMLVLTAILPLTIGHTAYYLAIRNIGATPASAVIQLQPFTVAALSVWLRDEVLTFGQWAWGTVAALGAMLMLYVQHQTAAQDRKEQRTQPADEDDLLVEEPG